MTISLSLTVPRNQYVPDFSSQILLLTAHKVPKFFEESSLDDADWIKSILDDDSEQKNEEKVVLEGGKSGIKLSFFSNRMSPLPVIMLPLLIILKQNPVFSSTPTHYPRASVTRNESTAETAQNR